MNEKEKYALEWNNSAQHFFENKSYKHLSEHISQYKTVLEIGCGTGQSTLALLKAGHCVIAIDQNIHCIKNAKKLIKESGFIIKENALQLAPGMVFFIECDVIETDFANEIFSDLSIDIVVCWNIGSYWDKEKLEKSVPKMLQYGLTPEQIQSNPESSYGELVIWCACTIAEIKKCAVHIVDRGTQKVTKSNDPYYLTLKKEFHFKKIKYANLESTTLSKGGRQLITNGEVHTQNELPIIFVSVLME